MSSYFYKPLKSARTTLDSFILGPSGVGKTTLFNSVMDTDEAEGVQEFQITEKLVKTTKSIDGQLFALWDGPGIGCSKDQWESSSFLRHGLSYEPLNAVFIVVQYDSRLKNIVTNFMETLQTLKKEDWCMAIPVVTKFN